MLTKLFSNLFKPESIPSESESAPKKVKRLRIRATKKFIKPKAKKHLTEEMILNTSGEQLVELIINDIDERLKSIEDYQTLTAGQQSIYLTHHLEKAFAQGGFDSYFDSAYNKYITETVEAYRSINAPNFTYVAQIALDAYMAKNQEKLSLVGSQPDFESESFALNTPQLNQLFTEAYTKDQLPLLKSDYIKSRLYQFL